MEMNICSSKPFAHSISALASTLNKFLPPGQHFISPLSLAMAMAMLYEGSSDKPDPKGPRTILEQIIGIEVNPAERHRMVRELVSIGGPDKKRSCCIGGPDKKNKFTLTMANSIFISKDFQPKKQFLATLKKTYDSNAMTLDFKGDKNAHKKINTWIKKKTKGCIKDMLEQVSESTVALLVNAIYFKAKWEIPFKENNSH